MKASDIRAVRADTHQDSPPRRSERQASSHALRERAPASGMSSDAGLSVRQLAELLGVRPGAIYARLSRNPRSLPRAVRIGWSIRFVGIPAWLRRRTIGGEEGVVSGFSRLRADARQLSANARELRRRLNGLSTPSGLRLPLHLSRRLVALRLELGRMRALLEGSSPISLHQRAQQLAKLADEIAWVERQAKGSDGN